MTLQTIPVKSFKTTLWTGYTLSLYQPITLLAIRVTYIFLFTDFFVLTYYIVIGADKFEIFVRTVIIANRALRRSLAR